MYLCPYKKDFFARLCSWSWYTFLIFRRKPSIGAWLCFFGRQRLCWATEQCALILQLSTMLWPCWETVRGIEAARPFWTVLWVPSCGLWAPDYLWHQLSSATPLITSFLSDLHRLTAILSVAFNRKRNLSGLIQPECIEKSHLCANT